MNGAQALIATLTRGGIEVCFTNPGTSEIYFVAALDGEPKLRPVLCLFEGVATGAADGYGRMTGKPAATLLHLGPGLANGLANLHNARRASTPIVNIIGDHASTHMQYDAPLTSDIEGLARPVSAWVHRSTSVNSVASDGAHASFVAQQAPGQIATLIVPADHSWSHGATIAEPLAVIEAQAPASVQIEAIAKKLINNKDRRSALLLRGGALSELGLLHAGRIAAKINLRLLCDTLPPRLRRGAGIVSVERLPYFPEQAVSFLEEIDQIILVGSTPPVSFFAYPDMPSFLSKEDCLFEVLARPDQDGVKALSQLADALDAPSKPALVADSVIGQSRDGFNQFSIGAVLAKHLPENAILIDDAATSGLGSFIASSGALPHDYLGLTGGAIGIGMPLAVGAAIACPQRKVITLSGDGSAAYTLQALWTQARENLNIITIVFANQSYAILNIELGRAGLQAGQKASSVLDLDRPSIDWVALAQGMGVSACRVQSIDALQAQLAAAMAQKNPQLIEVILLD